MLHNYTIAVGDNPADPTKNLWEALHDDAQAVVRANHVARDGTPHVLPDDEERIVADLLPIAVWQGARP